jgi:peptidoglycan/xylan/chitin deacetylase (PgdA/CDA1 family)
MNPFPDFALRSIVSLAAGIYSPPDAKPLNIIMFHRVRPSEDPIFPEEPDSAQFDRLMGALASSFNCLALDQAVAMLRAGTPLPSRALAITFDDGYADNCTVALPILKRHGLTATFFVASGFLDGGVMWNDEVIELIRCYPNPTIDLGAFGLGTFPSATPAERRLLIDKLLMEIKYRHPLARREALDTLSEITGGKVPRDLMMTKDQVRKLHSSGMSIGGHTLGHPILSSLDATQAMNEIGADRENLTSILGTAPELFAYPNGKPGKDYHSEHPGMVRTAGYTAAFSTAWGAARHGDDLLQIPRFTPWDKNVARFALRLAHNYSRTSFASA